MKVLIACEFSGVVRDAFIRKGHDAISCDLLDTELPGPHYQGDVLDIINKDWDLIIAHPPCTYLTVSNNKAMKYGCKKYTIEEGKELRKEAINFFMLFANLSCERVVIENPIGIMSRLYKKPSQIIQPWMFGHGETKATCLWIKNLPLLVPTNIVDGRENRIHLMPPSKDRWKERSKTFTGIAEAMADQWG